MNKTVKDIIELLNIHVHYELIGARTGKKLASSYVNTEETLKKYSNMPVTDTPVFCGFKNSRDSLFPVIKIYVLGM